MFKALPIAITAETIAPVIQRGMSHAEIVDGNAHPEVLEVERSNPAEHISVPRSTDGPGAYRYMLDSAYENYAGMVITKFGVTPEETASDRRRRLHRIRTRK